MKTLGLIGGMSWESSADYYRLINRGIRERLGGQHSAKLVLVNVDFAEIEHMQMHGHWDAAGQAMVEAARQLQAGGAECIVLCTNTMHKVAPAIQQAVDLPFLHIADAAGGAVCRAGLKRVGLLGTRFTMTQDFYTGKLTHQYGLDVLIPDEADQTIVHDIIYNELCQGVVNAESRRAYQRIMSGLIERGAEGIVLACTEIPMLIKPQDASVPVFDTTALHVQEAIAFALNHVDSSV